MFVYTFSFYNPSTKNKNEYKIIPEQTVREQQRKKNNFVLAAHHINYFFFFRISVAAGLFT